MNPPPRPPTVIDSYVKSCYGGGSTIYFGPYTRIAALVCCFLGTSVGVGAIATLSNDPIVRAFFINEGMTGGGAPLISTFAVGAGCGIAAVVLSFLVVLFECCCIPPHRQFAPAHPPEVTSLNVSREWEMRAAAAGAAQPPPTAPYPAQPTPEPTTAQLPMGPCPYWKLVTNGEVTCAYLLSHFCGSPHPPLPQG